MAEPPAAQPDSGFFNDAGLDGFDLDIELFDIGPPPAQPAGAPAPAPSSSPAAWPRGRQGELLERLRAAAPDRVPETFARPDGSVTFAVARPCQPCRTHMLGDRCEALWGAMLSQAEATRVSVRTTDELLRECTACATVGSDCQRPKAAKAAAAAAAARAAAAAAAEAEKEAEVEAREVAAQQVAVAAVAGAARVPDPAAAPDTPLRATPAQEEAFRRSQLSFAKREAYDAKPTTLWNRGGDWVVGIPATCRACHERDESAACHIVVEARFSGVGGGDYKLMPKPATAGVLQACAACRTRGLACERFKRERAKRTRGRERPMEQPAAAAAAAASSAAMARPKRQRSGGRAAAAEAEAQARAQAQAQAQAQARARAQAQAETGHAPLDVSAPVAGDHGGATVARAQTMQAAHGLARLDPPRRERWAWALAGLAALPLPQPAAAGSADVTGGEGSPVSAEWRALGPVREGPAVVRVEEPGRPPMFATCHMAAGGRLEGLPAVFGPRAVGVTAFSVDKQALRGALQAVWEAAVRLDNACHDLPAQALVLAQVQVLASLVIETSLAWNLPVTASGRPPTSSVGLS